LIFKKEKLFMTASLNTRALTEIETAAYIGMSRAYLRQARMEGKRGERTPAPPFIKIGRSVRYLREDLDQWLSNQQKLDHLGQWV
jgi:predicted DNA-binding transcriptional regulator AlpA